MSENLAEQVIRPTYEQIVGSIRHSGVREMIAHAQQDEQRVRAELARIEENEDLNDEARRRMAQEILERYSPKISEAYKSAREKLAASTETSYLFSLPFPEGKTYAQAKVKDVGELAVVQQEAEAISRRISGKSLQEATKAVSKVPGGKGIRESSNHTVTALRQEFDKAMSEGGIEGRVRAMAVRRVCEGMGIGLGQVVDHHRKDAHYRALEDSRRSEQQAFALPSRTTIRNPFDSKRRGSRAVGTYGSVNPAVVTGGAGSALFQKKNRRRAWK
jgi:hypothetical protein